MPVYKYAHDCGYEHEQFLKQDKQTVLLKCLRCGRDVTARQIRDNSVKFAEKDHVVGVIHNEQKT